LPDNVIYKRCNRCGGFVEFKRPDVGLLGPDDPEPEELTEWKRIRDTVSNAEHGPGQCPHEIAAAAEAALGKHGYQVKLSLYRDGELEAEVSSDTINGITFADVAAPVSKTLSERWDRLVQMAAVIDSPPEPSGE